MAEAFKSLLHALSAGAGEQVGGGSSGFVGADGNSSPYGVIAMR
jgi:hypothetical protein